MPSEPLIITFVNEPFIPLLDAWVTSVRALGVRRVRAYALDQATLEWCSARGVEAWPLQSNGTRAALWLARRFNCWTATNHATATFDDKPLSVALLPHREFQRLPEDHERVIVRHFITPSRCADKLRTLRALGVLPP